MRPPSHTRGFTLIELSIVLVIIGLIVGGVLVGQDLIHNAEVQSIMTEAQRYATAFNSFKDKYDALPGDMPNATSIWGTNPNCGSNLPGTGTETCNGNGDGLIESYTESFYAWQHLGNAGMVPGSFSGQVTGSGGTVVVPGVDAPPSKYLQNVWVPFYFSFADHGVPQLGSDERNRLYLGQNMPGSTGWQAGIRCDDAFRIDTKYDDGMPFTGRIQSLWGCVWPLTNPASPYVSSYGIATFMRFDLGE
jgi:prepilin-type N-terminal cleavage/methylation domain-containing protein